VSAPRFAENSTVGRVCTLIEEAIFSLNPPLSPGGLLESERLRLSGLLFFGSYQFITRMSEALRHAPHLSPDLQRINADSLIGRLRRATIWSMIHSTLTQLADFANDCYLFEHGSAIAESQQVLHAFDLAMAQSLLRDGPDAQMMDDIITVSHARKTLDRCQIRRKQHRYQAKRTLKFAERKTKPNAEKTTKPRKEKLPQPFTLDTLRAWGQKGRGG
jgi:hypothetical protein